MEEGVDLVLRELDHEVVIQRVPKLVLRDRASAQPIVVLKTVIFTFGVDMQIVQLSLII